MTGDNDRLDDFERDWKIATRVHTAIPELIQELRDARAEIERLTEFGIDLAVHEKVVTQLGATRTDCRALQEQLDSYVAESERLAAELAAERAKVQQVEAVYAARLDRDSDEPCWELWVALGNALVGGCREQET